MKKNKKGQRSSYPALPVVKFTSKLIIPLERPIRYLTGTGEKDYSPISLMNSSRGLGLPAEKMARIKKKKSREKGGGWKV